MVRVEFVALLVIVIVPDELPVAAGANFAERVAFWPAGMVTGVVSPLMLKPVPVMVAWEIVALALPLFVSVIVCELLLPTATFPKAKLPGLAISDAFAATPLPEKESVCGDPGALSVKTMLPVTPPAAVGAKTILKEVLWPFDSVTGSEIPLMVKPVPVNVARLTTVFTFPVLVNVTVCEALWPTVTFPKFSDAGETESPGCVPLPLREIVAGEFDASLTTVRLPFTAPEVGGPN
jgi:hypothetical protein